MFKSIKMKSNKLNSEVYEYINQYTNEIINSKEFRSKYAKRLTKTFLLSEVLHILKSLSYKKDKYYEF